MYAKEESDPSGLTVSCLSDLLNACGINCDIDLYHVDDNVMDWSVWMDECLKCHVTNEHCFVIMVCSSTMISALEEKNDDACVKMVEGFIHCQTLRYYLKEYAQKFLPLCINDPSPNCVPPSLGKTCYYFPYDKLLHEIPEDATTDQLLNHPDFASLRNLVDKLNRQQNVPMHNQVDQGKI